MAAKCSGLQNLLEVKVIITDTSFQFLCKRIQNDWIGIPNWIIKITEN